MLVRNRAQRAADHHRGAGGKSCDHHALHGNTPFRPAQENGQTDRAFRAGNNLCAPGKGKLSFPALRASSPAPAKAPHWRRAPPRFRPSAPKAWRIWPDRWHRAADRTSSTLQAGDLAVLRLDLTPASVLSACWSENDSLATASRAGRDLGAAAFFPSVLTGALPTPSPRCATMSE